MMRRKGNRMIALGLLLIAAALFLIVWNMREAAEAGTMAKNVLDKMSDAQSESTALDGNPADDEVPDYILNPNMEMPTETIERNKYIGILEIPTLGLKLPVMSEWSYPGLKIAPCRYAGSAYLNNMVIAAHNYYSYFGYLNSLSPGDGVTFTDVDGNEFQYKVVEIETISSYGIEEMTSGEWDLTLFTCTASGQSRVTVRCERVENNSW